MNHRMTVTEAIAEAGGVLTTGDKSKVVVLRRQTDWHAGTDSGQCLGYLQRQGSR